MVLISLIYQQNEHIQYNTCIIIKTLLLILALIEPSSGRSLSYAQNYCYFVGLQILSCIIHWFTTLFTVI